MTKERGLNEPPRLYNLDGPAEIAERGVQETLDQLARYIDQARDDAPVAFIFVALHKPQGEPAGIQNISIGNRGEVATLLVEFTRTWYAEFAVQMAQKEAGDDVSG